MSKTPAKAPARPMVRTIVVKARQVARPRDDAAKGLHSRSALIIALRHGHTATVASLIGVWPC